MTTVARGPKPVTAMKAYGITPTIKVPSPNTWREVLSTLDQQLSVNQVSIALQEYGKPNLSLVAGLEARGAHIQTVKVYRWELPEDTSLLERNIRAIIAGEIDVLMFTSAQQSTNLFALAGQLGLEDELKAQFDLSLIHI